jgi:hypothetical protein
MQGAREHRSKDLSNPAVSRSRVCVCVCARGDLPQKPSADPSVIYPPQTTHGQPTLQPRPPSPPPPQHPSRSGAGGGVGVHTSAPCLSCTGKHMTPHHTPHHTTPPAQSRVPHTGHAGLTRGLRQQRGLHGLDGSAGPRGHGPRPPRGQGPGAARGAGPRPTPGGASAGGVAAPAPRPTATADAHEVRQLIQCTL